MALLSSYTDEQLVLLLSKGEERAFAEIYDRYAEELVSYAAARLASLDEAKDIIHDLFVKIWQQKETIVIHTSLRAYLFTAIRYRIINHIRRQSNHTLYTKFVQALDASVTTPGDSVLEANDLRKQLEKSVEDLEPRAQEIYNLSRQQQLSISEIASHLNISEKTVKNQLTTALGHLRRSLEKLTIITLSLFQ